MSVQFILGRSGTSKTSFLIETIVSALLERADNQPLILLVPEQASYQAEQAILADERIAGYNGLSVLSFDRLQFLLSGRNTARAAVSRIGRQMIIHRILRDLKSELKILGSSATLTGLGRQAAETVAELYRYAKMPDDIDQLLAELKKDERNSLTALKFADISLVFKQYLKFIEGKFVDPDFQLTCARRAVTEADFVKGARLWVDGFAGFTTAELEILAELLKAAKETQIALCLDPSKVDLKKPSESVDPAGLFNSTERTYADILDIVRKSRLKLVEPVILKEAVRFSRCRQLGHIEQNLFEPKPLKMLAADNVRIVSAASARSEVQFVAGQILKLVKQDNYRFRDIAVIASDIENYEHYIRAYFEDYRIPFFIDKRKSLNQHPVVGLISSALEVVTEGFSHGDIFAYLKSGFVPVEDFDIDVLENYCLAFGIDVNDWQSDKPWRFQNEKEQRFDEKQINNIRLKVAQPLLKLRDELCPAAEPAKMLSAAEFTKVIFDFLDSLGVRERVCEWIEEAIKHDDYAAVDEHRQFYSKFVDIFDELVEAFADQQMTCSDYLAVCNMAFSQMKLAFIPPSLDQVLVGSIERSRHPDLKAVFLIGATQKQFPVPVVSSGLLTDDDRKVAEGKNFLLAPAVEQTLAQRQYLAYIAFTRPSQFLCVTYPLVDEKESATTRSQFITNLESLFEGLNEESISAGQIDIENLHSEGELAELLCRRLGRDSLLPGTADKKQLRILLDEVCADKELAEHGLAVRSAINYDNIATLDSRVVEELFGERLTSSATRLSTYAACPYRYFARYILELEERKEFKFEPLDVGLFYHHILNALTKQLGKEKKDFATIAEGRLIELLREQISRIIQTDSFVSNFKSRSFHNAFIINSACQVLEDCVIAIGQMVRAGGFRPFASEVSFGQVEGSSDNLGEYKISLSDGRVLTLNGKIDRLDIADIGGEKAALVFDYKRREKSFSWREFYYGLDMQLPIYLLAVRNATKAEYQVQVVTGAFYMPVEVSPKKRELSELQRQSSDFAYKAKGIFSGDYFRELDTEAAGRSRFYNFQILANGSQYGRYRDSGALKPDDFEKVLCFAEEKIIELVRKIISGEISVKPYRLGGKSPCSYCEYKPVCRFDWQINDYNALASVSKTEMLERIETVDG